MIAVLSALCAFTGCNNASKQRTENTSSETNLPSCQKTSQDKPNVIEIDGTPYLALNKLLVLPDDAQTEIIPQFLMDPCLFHSTAIIKIYKIAKIRDINLPIV